MIPVSAFETTAPEAARIWDAGLSLYNDVEQNLPDKLLTHPYALCAFCDATLYLAGNAANAIKIFDDTIEYLMTSDRQRYYSIICALPLALESIYTYTHDADFLASRIKRLEILREGLRGEHVNAFDIGYETVMVRIKAECGMPLLRAQLGRSIVEYHATHYDADSMLYRDEMGEVSLTETVLASAFGFLSDDARENVRNYLLEHAFELDRDMCGFLYMALSNLEVKDAFYSCLVESGLPVADAGAEYLSGIVALIKYMVGVDMSMFGKQIECASPRMPSHIGYRLMLPSGRMYLSYESEGTGKYVVLGGVY